MPEMNERLMSTEKVCITFSSVHLNSTAFWFK